MTRLRRRGLGVGFVAAIMVAVVVFAGCASSPDTGTTWTSVIPRGAAVAADSTALTSLPHRFDDGMMVLEFAAGDRLIVENNDVVPHAIGFLNVRPQERVDHLFRTPGRYEGDCTLLGDIIVIEVT